MGERLSNALWVAGSLIFGVAVYLLVVALAPKTAASPSRSARAGGSSGAGVGSAGEMSGESVEVSREMREKAAKGEQFYGPLYQLFRDDGRVNPRLLSLAGIPLSRAEEAQAIIDRAWDRVSADLEARKKPLPEESDRTKPTMAYFVAGDPEKAQLAKDQIRSEIAAAFGEAAARIFTPYVTDGSLLSGFGGNDITITISSQEGYGGTKTVANFKISEAKTGKLVSNGGTSDADSFRRRFGNVFFAKEFNRK